MSLTATDFSADPQPSGKRSARPEPGSTWDWITWLLKPIASLQLTVVLFALSMFLVFCGTLAQVEMGLWTAMDTYFRSDLVWIPFQLFVKFGQVFLHVPPTFEIGGAFPFPGGWLLGSLLLANLLAAHLVRFKISWKRSGVLLIHAGLIIMMLSELITGVFAIEARMTLGEGETSSYVEVHREVELALVDSSDPKADNVVVVPDNLLKNEGLIQSDDLPVDIRVNKFMVNSLIVNADEAPESDSPIFESLLDPRYRFKIIPQKEESGAASDQTDAPAVQVQFLKKGTQEPLSSHMLAVWFEPNVVQRRPILKFAPQTMTVGDKTYNVALRPRRIYKPYSIRLIDFRFDRYVGTDKPKNYSSLVRLKDPEKNEDREFKIAMNEPLRHRGETFYQSGFTPDEKGTVLQVVDNPGWLMPYISCVIVSLGMLVHFGMNLLGFLKRRAA